AEAFLREQFGIPPNVAVNLDALLDPPPGVRPNYTNSQLARLAIYGHPRHRATLDQLLKAIENRFEWYRKENKSWRGSIRHLLSLESLYVKVGREKTDPGSGSYWTLDIRDPKGMKRLRKR
ncbi:winged helix DNA-binding domain-containing protein, partial [Armillaria gallica]